MESLTMDSTVQYEAWIETPGGSRTVVERSCSIGRSKKSAIVLDDERISRRHALIHCQGNGEYSLVDLGSANGTRLNGRRVVHPKPLNDADEIEIGGFRMRFRMGRSDSHEVSGKKTVREIKTENCWLMLADIVDATGLMKSTDPSLSVSIGQWFSTCGEKIEANGGAINKYLGDGWLAFWSDDSGSDARVASALAALMDLQGVGFPDFRLILHCGPILIGGMPSNLEDPLLGPELNFIFRVEKVAAALAVRRCLTGPAAKRLENRFRVASLGSHKVRGFEETHNLFAFEKKEL